MNARLVGSISLIIIILAPIMVVMAWDLGWASLLFWLVCLVIAHLTGMAIMGTWNPWRTLWPERKEENS